jgi:hypothetical protein
MPSRSRLHSLSLGLSLSAALAAPSPPTVTLLSHLHNNHTWYGGSAIALQAPTDPVFMTSTWVYSPVALFGDRPLATPSPTNWSTITTKDMRFQTLDVAAAMANGAGKPARALSPSSPPSSSSSPATFVDSLAFWLEKPDGINGTCVLVGFNSAFPPKVDGTGPLPAGTVWRSTVGVTGCENVNLWTPATSFVLSSDGSVAAVWVMGPDGSFTLQTFDGQTGSLLWTVVNEPPPPPSNEMFFSNGIGLSADGRFAVIDSGVAGLGDHSLYIHDVQSPNGTLRDLVPSTVAVQGSLSHDGAYIYTCPTQSTAAVDLWRWDEKTSAYVDLGTANAPLPPGSEGETQWYLVAGTFGFNAAANRTLFAAVWVAASLDGNGVAAVWYADTFTTGRQPDAAYPFTTVGGDIAIDGAAVACDGPLCVVGLEAAKLNGNRPTVVLFDLSVPAEGADDGAAAVPRPPVWNFTSPGTINSISISLGGAGGKTAYILASGCDSYGICVAPGADSYAWEVTGW